VVVVEPVAGVLTDGVVAEVGRKVATNGEYAGRGRITGTLSRVRNAEGVPSCTVTVPVAAMTWTAPAWRTPAQMVEPVETEVAATQHDPVATTVTW
jgi:hypothetical protein